MRRHLWTLLALLVALPASAQQVEEKKPADTAKPADAPKPADKPAEVATVPGGPPVEVQFSDGSLVKLTLLDPKVEVTTRYGKLSVPLNEIRRIELGARYPEGALQKIQDALTRLGDPDFKKREAAGAELLAFRELAYPHLRRAAAQGGNPEVVQRTKKLLEELRSRLPEDKLTLKDHDTVTTADFPIAGQIGAAIFKARSPLLGDVDVKLVQVRAIRWMGTTSEASLTLDAGKHGGPQETWLDTGIDLSGDKVVIQASGTVDVMPQNPGQFMAGPDGLRVDVGFRGGGRPPVGQPGALVGRVGTSGQPFFVGPKYEGTPGGEGRLYLRLEPSPWRVAMTGSFNVKISTGK